MRGQGNDRGGVEGSAGAIMADIRKVKFMPRDGGDYFGWINFDRVLYAEDHGLDGKARRALIVMDDGQQFTIDAKAINAGRSPHGRRP